jgi:hypothetical protein
LGDTRRNTRPTTSGAVIQKPRCNGVVRGDAKGRKRPHELKMKTIEVRGGREMVKLFKMRRMEAT